METKRKTILLVEDDAIIAILEKRWLIKDGYHVIHVTTGEKAIEILEEDLLKIDLILMDIDLGPGMDGTETAREILIKHDTPLLFLSSHTEPDLVRKTEEISSYGYVLKGSSETVLLASIRMAFRLYQAQRELNEKAEIITAEKIRAEQYLNVAEVILVALDIEGKITLLNRKGCQVLGYNENELIGKKWVDLFLVPEESDRLLGYFNEMVNGRIHDFEYIENHIFTRSGMKKLVAWHNSLLKDKDGKIIGVLSSGEDITEKRRSEISLIESESNFRQLVENMGEGIGFVDQNETFVFANRSGEEIFGVGPGQLIGRNLSEFHDEKEFEKAIFETGLRRKGVKSVFETIIKLPNGREKILLVTATPRFNPAGEFLGTFGIFRDITDRKETERKLKESEQRLSEIAKNIPGIVYQYSVKENGSSYFSYLSEKAAELLGLTLEAENPEIKLRMLVPEEDRERFSQSIINAVKKAGNWEYEGRFSCKGGITKWFQANALPTRSGNELVYNGILIDITERKEAEILQKKYSDELRLSNATKDKFFSILAHDLRGPFSGFMGLTEEMANNIDDLSKEDISEYAAVMNSTAKRLFELLTNILEWSRLQNGNIELKPESSNLFEIVYSIQALFFSSAANKSVIINNLISKEIYLLADIYSLTTILRNLISNAVKFTPAGGNIRISAEPVGNQMEIKVSDSGVGMSAEAMIKAFRIDSGFTTKGTEGEEGTGLGLILCKDLANKNNWEMDMESSPQKGTTVILRVPYTAII